MALIGRDEATVDKDRLQKKLEKILDKAEANERAGESNGAECYQDLWRLASKHVDEFCAKHEIRRELVMTELPVLRQLHRMSQPKMAAASGGIWLWSPILALLGAGFVGLLFGIAIKVAHLIAR